MAVDLTQFDETELAALFGITFIALFVFANTGLGPGMIFQIGYWSLAALGYVDHANLSTVLVYLSFSKYPMGMLQSIYKRKFIFFQIKVAIILVISCAISTSIGIFILVRYQGDILVRVLGGLLLLSLFIACIKEHIFNAKPKRKGQRARYITNTNIEMSINGNTNTHSVVHSVNRNMEKMPLFTAKTSLSSDSVATTVALYEKHEIPKDVVFYRLNSYKKIFGLIITALISGTCRGLFGVGGPPFIIYQLITDFDRRSFRVLMAFADGFGSGLMTMIFLLFAEKKFDSSQWLVYVTIFIAACLGLTVGNICAKYVDQAAFKITMQFLLFCGALNLLFVDLGEISIYGSVGLMILFMIIAIGLVFRHCLLFWYKKGYKERRDHQKSLLEKRGLTKISYIDDVYQQQLKGDELERNIDAQQVIEWKLKFNELNDKYDELDKDYVNIKNERDMILKNHERLKAEYQKLKDVDFGTDIGMYKRRIIALNDEKGSLLDLNKKLNVEISEMSETIDHLNELCETYRDSIDSYKERLSEMEKERKEYLSEIDHFRRKNSDQIFTNEMVEQLKISNDEWNQKYNDMSIKLKNIEIEKLSLTNTIKQYEKQLTNILSIKPDDDDGNITNKSEAMLKYQQQHQSQSCKQLLKRGHHENVENLSKITILNTKCQQLQSRLDDERAKNKQNIANMERKMDVEINKIKMKYEAKLSHSTSMIDQLNVENQKLKSKLYQ